MIPEDGPAGYFFALAALALIGSYMVPTRFARTRGSAFLPYLAMGLLASLLFFPAQLRALWAHPDRLRSALLSGCLWAAGQALANDALEELSLAKASVFFNVNSFINIALGILLFHEATGLRPAFFLFGGGALLFFGARMVAGVAAPPKREGDLRKGILLALLAGFFWGIYFVPIQAVQARTAGAFTSAEALAGMILGGALPALMFGLWKGRGRLTMRDTGWGFLTAAFWVGGTLFFLKANRVLGLSRAVPIVNCSVLVYSFWSLLFRELPLSQWPKVLGGAMVVAAGVLVMAFSR